MIGSIGFAAGRSAGEYYGAIPAPSGYAFILSTIGGSRKSWQEAGTTPPQSANALSPPLWPPDVTRVSIEDGSKRKDETKYVQTILYRFNLLEASDIDGIYGPKTAAAVSTLQSWLADKGYNVGVTGGFGIATFNAFLEWGNSSGFAYVNLGPSSTAASKVKTPSDAVTKAPSSSRSASSASAPSAPAPSAPAPLAPQQASVGGAAIPTNTLIAYGALGLGALVAVVAVSSLIRGS